MKDVCRQCHTTPVVDRVYAEAEQVVASTNARVQQFRAVMDGLRKDSILSGPPFTHPIDFLYFDLWHYYGRTSKHGALMGGADFVQWHGNYPLLKHAAEIKALAGEMRRAHGKGK